MNYLFFIETQKLFVVALFLKTDGTNFHYYYDYYYYCYYNAVVVLFLILCLYYTAFLRNLSEMKAFFNSSSESEK